MVTANYRLLVDWNGDGDWLDPYDNVASDTLRVNYRRGRDYASQLTGNSTAGKLTAVLKNDDGKYSPNNPSSPLFGSIIPGRKVQLQIGASSAFPYSFPFDFSTEQAPMWTGYLEKIRPSPASQGANTCTLTAYGALGYLNEFLPESTTRSYIRTDEAIDVILNDVGWTDPALKDLAVGQTTMIRWWTTDQPTIRALRIVEETEAGFVKETKDGKISFESRVTRLNAPYNTSQATFSDANGATNTYLRLEQEDPLSTVVNHVEAMSRSYTFNYLSVLWESPETGADSPELVPGQSRTFIAKYPNPNSPNNAVSVEAWQDLVANTDYVANSDPTGVGIDLTSSMYVFFTKLATQMVMTYRNDHPTMTAYLTTLQARGNSTVSNDPVMVRSVDTNSQGIYGDRKYTAVTEFLPTAQNAQSWCDYHVAVFRDPVNILKMSFSANSSQANMNMANNLDVSDRITVVADNLAGLGIDSDFYIETVEHTIAQSVHMTTWNLSPAVGGYSQLWKLDQGALDTSTVPSF